MAQISKQKLREILSNAPKGTTPEGIISGLVARGHQIEGLRGTTIDKAGGRQLVTTPGGAEVLKIPGKKSITIKAAPITSVSGKKKKKTFLNQVGDFIGLSGLAKGFSQAIFLKTASGRRLMEDLESGRITADQFDEAINLTQSNREGIATGKEVVGSAAQVALNIASVGGLGTTALKGAAATGKLVGGASKTLGLGTRVASGAGFGAGITASRQLQEQDKLSLGGIATGAAIGGAIPLAGAGAKSLFKKVTQKLPNRLVKSVIKQRPKELLAGRDAAETLLEKKRIGSIDSLIVKGQSAMDDLNVTIDKNLLNSKVQLDMSAISKGAARQLNEEGADITEDALLKQVQKMAPKVGKLLKQRKLNIKNANSVRIQIDKILGDKAFIGGQQTFTKDLLKTYSNTLRNTVQDVAPAGTRTAFKELSKEITLQRALLATAARDGGKKIVGVSDILAIIGGGAVGGGPGSAALFAGRRALTGPTGAIGTAQALRGIGTVGKKLSESQLGGILSKLSPLEKTLIMDAIGQGTVE